MIRSKVTKSNISMGRLHVETKATGLYGSIQPKSKEFLDWYSCLAKWTKRNFRRMEESSIYIGPDADCVREKGASLGGYSF